MGAIYDASDCVRERVRGFLENYAENGECLRQDIHRGGIEIAIWENEGENGAWYSITHRRSYKQGDQWKEADYYGEDDLLRLAKMVNEADSWIAAQRQQRRAQKAA